MRILGLDISLTNTGWVIYDINKLKVVSCGTIKSKKKNVIRLYDIRKQLKEIIEKYKIDVSILEGYAFNPNHGRSFSIGELGGTIKLLLFYKRKYYYIVSPSSLKKFATGKGNSPKTLIYKEVYKKWNVEFDTEHEVDAFVLAKIGHAIMYPTLDEWTKYQKSVVKKIIKDESKRNYVGRRDERS